MLEPNIEDPKTDRSGTTEIAGVGGDFSRIPLSTPVGRQPRAPTRREHDVSHNGTTVARAHQFGPAPPPRRGANGRSHDRGLPAGLTEDALESDADRLADAALGDTAGGAPRPTGLAPPPTLLPDGAVRVVGRSGAPLEPDLRRDMERRFGADFSAVRVHADAEAARSALELQADAYTVGRDIVFGAGQLRSWTPRGRRLLAHELAHTVQQQGARPFLQRQASDAPTLDQAYEAAVRTGRQTGNWQRAAELLNGFSHEDIQTRLARLTDAEVASLHQGAVDHPRVGPGSQVARLTAAGTPRASTLPPAASFPPPRPAARAGAPAQASEADVIARMSVTEKLVAAYGRAPVSRAFRDRVASLFTPQSLVMAILGFVVVFVASQFTPVGWAADIGIFLTAVFIASSLWTAIRHLVAFAEARNATTSEQLDRAGAEFAAATAEITVDTLIFLVTHRLAGGRGGGGSSAAPQPVPVRLGVTPEGFFVPVRASTVPATVAVGLGAQGAIAAPALMTAMSSGGPPGTGGPRGPSGGTTRRAAEEAPPDSDATPPRGTEPPRRAGSRRRQESPRFQRISDANKQELQESGWLRRLLRDVDRRREFMEWLETNHRQGEAHIHLRPGSREADAALRDFLAENP